MFNFIIESLKTYEVTQHFGEDLKGRYGGKIPRLFISLDVQDIHLYVLFKNEEGSEFGNYSIEQCSWDLYDARDSYHFKWLKDGRKGVIKLENDAIDEWMERTNDMMDDIHNEARGIEHITFFGDPDEILTPERIEA